MPFNEGSRPPAGGQPEPPRCLSTTRQGKQTSPPSSHSLASLKATHLWVVGRSHHADDDCDARNPPRPLGTPKSTGPTHTDNSDRRHCPTNVWQERASELKLPVQQARPTALPRPEKAEASRTLSDADGKRRWDHANRAYTGHGQPNLAHRRHPSGSKLRTAVPTWNRRAPSDGKFAGRPERAESFCNSPPQAITQHSRDLTECKCEPGVGLQVFEM